VKDKPFILSLFLVGGKNEWLIQPKKGRKNKKNKRIKK